MTVEVVKNTRVETRENRNGRIQERTVTTWDVVEDGRLLSEHQRQKDALEARYQLLASRRVN